MGTLRWRLDHPVPPGPAVFAFWHRHVPVAAGFFRDWKATAMVSPSGDGQILADLLLGGGLDLVRASSSRGSLSGARRLLDSLKEGRSVVTAWDGPRGPAGVPKPGPGWLARSAGVPLFDVLLETSRPLRLGDWSGMEIPLPFSTVVVRFRQLVQDPLGEGLPA